MQESGDRSNDARATTTKRIFDVFRYDRPAVEQGEFSPRYPNRRTVLKVLSDPSFAPFEPYKFMAMELDVLPVSGKTVIPDIRWLLGGVFIIISSSSVGYGPQARCDRSTPLLGQRQSQSAILLTKVSPLSKTSPSELSRASRLAY